MSFRHLTTLVNHGYAAVFPVCKEVIDPNTQSEKKRFGKQEYRGILSLEMSTSSKPKNRAPTHQNRTSFKHNKNSKKTNAIAASATTYCLCQKCSEKQQWRIKVGVPLLSNKKLTSKPKALKHWFSILNGTNKKLTTRVAYPHNTVS